MAKTKVEELLVGFQTVTVAYHGPDGPKTMENVKAGVDAGKPVLVYHDNMLTMIPWRQIIEISQMMDKEAIELIKYQIAQMKPEQDTMVR
jgi:hypothetical protein